MYTKIYKAYRIISYNNNNKLILNVKLIAIDCTLLRINFSRHIFMSLSYAFLI